MIYYMHSKTFFEHFLDNESDRDILNAQYICVSTHIRRKDTKMENIICLKSILYPDTSVFNKGSFEDMRDEYHEQLSNDDATTLIAELIRGSIEDNLNIVLICTKSEWKLKYLKWLAEYIMLEFDYPVYNYLKYIQGCPLLKYDREKVLKSVKPITESAQKKLFNEERKSKKGQKRIIENYRSMSKKELKKICIDEDLYYDGMSKQEMLDMLESFL